ncbi:hypothetical protein HG536_0D02280 [Torulaspora globosa]|uniref:Required for respiratory growth protein 1, mitochondrial n=1 Tax=Torulaspora globosa TaxID=48254 RepID=A0A7G3ZGS0_9SACH|nr:uncharacterized protein HG536_0D02280 [Torulaspora globosa]QLL32706.1 hypothetical protein HG536_0D02280 [Torulaspora globosa]
MVQNFSYLSRHKAYVLALYRYTLRATASRCSSVHLRCRIRNTLRDIMSKHKHDKSSWTVFRLLEKMGKLNKCLKQGDVQQVWSMLTAMGKKKKPHSKKPVTHALREFSQSAPGTESLSLVEQRESHMLAQYISRNQQHGRLPRHIPHEYQMKLLLPLATHEKDVEKLRMIEAQLSKGPPKCFLTSTAAGSGKIWFVRSAVNKGKRQSRNLGIFLRREKKLAQKRLNYWESCKNNANWALHEAIWEQCLEDGTILHFAPEKYLRSLNLSLDDDENPVPLWKDRECPAKVVEWLQPIKDAMDSLARINLDRKESFKKHRDDVLLTGGQFEFYKNQGNKLHARRVKRFEHLVQDELPYVVPYISGRDLRSLLSKYRL